MAKLQAPPYGLSVVVNWRSYTTDRLGQIEVTRQADINTLLGRGWKTVSAPVPAPAPTPTPVPTPVPVPAVTYSLDGMGLRFDNGTTRLSAAPPKPAPVTNTSRFDTTAFRLDASAIRLSAA